MSRLTRNAPLIAVLLGLLGCDAASSDPTADATPAPVTDAAPPPRPDRVCEPPAPRDAQPLPTAPPDARPAPADAALPDAQPSDATVPEVVGKPLEDARKALTDAGFEVADPTTEASREPKGTVIKQSPAAGEPAKHKSMVRLVVAEAAGIEVPKVTGNYLAKAKKTLQEAGLTVGAVRRVEHEELGQDYVLRQDPKPGAEVPPGTEVELTVVAPN